MDKYSQVQKEVGHRLCVVNLPIVPEISKKLLDKSSGTRKKIA